MAPPSLILTSLAGPSYIPVNVEDMVYPEASAENRELRRAAVGKSPAPLPAEPWGAFALLGHQFKKSSKHFGSARALKA